MNTTNNEASTVIDPKVLDKIQKMLRLANDGGATEGEAAAALEIAEATMRKYNLSMAELEASGNGTSDRSKNELSGKAMYKYQQQLMRVIAEVNFCAVVLREKYNSGTRRYMPAGYSIIGRQANVVSAVEMFKYLNATIDRMVKTQITDYRQTLSNAAMSYKQGVAQRLQERLKERHDAALAEQSRKAREANAASHHPSAASNGTSLVVVMEDFAQKERDLNNDFQNGWAAGTTAARRAESEAKYHSRTAEREAQAEVFAEAERLRRANMTEAQRRKEDEKKARDSAKFWQKYDRQRERAASKLDYAAYRKGKEDGSTVGLDVQVGATKNTERLS